MNTYRRFHPRVRTALRRAEALARERGHAWTTAGHLVHALLEEEAGSEAEALRRRYPLAAPDPSPPPGNAVRHAPDLRGALDRAAATAAEGAVAPEDLLLALGTPGPEAQALGQRWRRVAGALLLGLALWPSRLEAAEAAPPPRSLSEMVARLRRSIVRPVEAPGSPALVNLARARLASGDAPGALKAAREGFERVDPKDSRHRAEAALVLGRVYVALEEWDLARRAFETGLEAHPDGPDEDELRYQLARLVARGLPAPEDLATLVERFVGQDPMTLDEDAMTYFLGFSRGLRLRRADQALTALEQVWREAPGGARVDRALLHAALIQGLALDHRDQARLLLDRLEAEHPDSPLFGLARLARAFVGLADGDLEGALEAVAGVPPQDGHSLEGAMLGAVLAGYYLANGERALYFLDHVERAGGRLVNLARYHRALLTLVRLQDYPGARACLEGLEGDEALPASWVTQLRGALDGILAAPSPLARDLRLARFFEQHGHYPRARYEYTRVLEQDPEGALGDQARLRLAALEQDDRGRFGPEVAALEQVVRRGQLGPAHGAEARWRLARARLKLGVEPDRIFQSQEAPGDAFSDSALRGLLLNTRSTDPERLRILYQLAGEMDSADASRPRILGVLGEALEDAGEWDQALQVYHQLLPDSPAVSHRIEQLMDKGRILALSPGGADPRSPERRTRLALYHLRLGDVERAEALLEGARKEAEGDAAASARATAYLARLLQRRGGRPERIREVLEDALGRPALPPRDRLVLVELQARRLAAEDPEAAQRVLRGLVKQGYAVRRLLPELVRRAEETDGPLAALSLFRLLVGELEPDAELAALAARLYDLTDQPRRARDARLRMARDWPRSPEAVEARARLAEHGARDLRKVLMSPLGMERKREALEAFLAEVEGDARAPHRLVLDEFAARFAEELPESMHLLLGRVYLNQFGDARRALPHLGEARDLPGAEGDAAWMELARAQEAAGDLRGAFGTYGAAAARSRELRPRALHARARLQRDGFQDPEAAFSSELEALAAGPDEALLVEVAQGIVQSGAAAAIEPARMGHALERLLEPLRGSDAEAEVRELRARSLLDSGRPLEAAAEWLRAAHLHADAAAAARAARAGLDRMLQAGKLDQVQREASRFLAARPGQAGTEEIRVLLRKASGRTQVETLLAAIDWGDPESAGNRDKLWRAGQLLVNPLEDFTAAATRLQEVVQLFPGSTEARQAQELLRKLPVLEGARAPGPAPPVPLEGAPAAPARPGRAEDRLAAARFVEYRLGDRARAAEAYRSLFEEDRGVVGLYAGIALLRILTLEPGDATPAWELVDRLRARPLPASLEGRFRGRLAALAGREQWVQLEAASRGHDPEAADQALVRMVDLAAAGYQDGPLAMAALRRLKGRAAKFDACLRAAAALDPSASPAPEAVGALAFLDFAVQVAPGPEERAQALVARGRYREATPAPALALPDYREAARLAPRSVQGEEALYLRSRLQLELGVELEEALAGLNQLVESFPGGERYLVASENAEQLARRLQARELDNRAAREGPRDPAIYFHTARLLAEKYDALGESLENYRTYLRVGERPSLLIRAHLEAAAVLVRMEKPAEALLMLERLGQQALAGIDLGDLLLRRGRILELEMARHEDAERVYRQVVAEHGDGAAAKEARAGLERIAGLRGDTGESSPRAPSGKEPAELQAIRDEYLRGRRRDYRAAAEALRAALDRSRNPGDRNRLALELAGIEDRHLQRYQEAADAYDLYLEGSQPGREQADILLRMAEIESTHLQGFARAHELYTRFLARYGSHPRRVPTMVLHGKVLERLDRVQEALQIYQIVIDSFPRSGHDEVALERLATLKRTYFAAFQEAVDAYRELISRFPFSRLADDSQYAIGRIYEVELGDLIRAKLEYETLIQRYPASEFLVLAQQGLTRIARR